MCTNLGTRTDTPHLFLSFWIIWQRLKHLDLGSKNASHGLSCNKQFVHHFLLWFRHFLSFSVPFFFRFDMVPQPIDGPFLFWYERWDVLVVFGTVLFYRSFCVLVQLNGTKPRNTKRTCFLQLGAWPWQAIASPVTHHSIAQAPCHGMA